MWDAARETLTPSSHCHVFIWGVSRLLSGVTQGSGSVTLRSIVKDVTERARCLWCCLSGSRTWVSRLQPNVWTVSSIAVYSHCKLHTYVQSEREIQMRSCQRQCRPLILWLFFKSKIFMWHLSQTNGLAGVKAPLINIYLGVLSRFCCNVIYWIPAHMYCLWLDWSQRHLDLLFSFYLLRSQPAVAAPQLTLPHMLMNDWFIIIIIFYTGGHLLSFDNLVNASLMSRSLPFLCIRAMWCFPVEEAKNRILLNGVKSKGKRCLPPATVHSCFKRGRWWSLNAFFNVYQRVKGNAVWVTQIAGLVCLFSHVKIKKMLLLSLSFGSQYSEYQCV